MRSRCCVPGNTAKALGQHQSIRNISGLGMVHSNAGAWLRFPTEQLGLTRYVPGFGPNDKSVIVIILHLRTLSRVGKPGLRGCSNKVSSFGSEPGDDYSRHKRLWTKTFKKLPTVESPLLLSNMRYIFRMLLSASVPWATISAVFQFMIIYDSPIQIFSQKTDQGKGRFKLEDRYELPENLLPVPSKQRMIWDFINGSFRFLNMKHKPASFDGRVC